MSFTSNLINISNQLMLYYSLFQNETLTKERDELKSLIEREINEHKKTITQNNIQFEILLTKIKDLEYKLEKANELVV